MSLIKNDQRIFQPQPQSLPTPSLQQTRIRHQHNIRQIPQPPSPKIPTHLPTPRNPHNLLQTSAHEFQASTKSSIEGAASFAVEQVLALSVGVLSGVAWVDAEVGFGGQGEQAVGGGDLGVAGCELGELGVGAGGDYYSGAVELGLLGALLDAF
jgi:hypothetical protein